MNRSLIVKSFAFVSAFTVVCPGVGNATNLVKNGDFSSGDSDFVSDYTFSPLDATPEGVYAIDTDPANVHPLWSSFGDLTTGTGNMMIVNGSVTPGQTVWSQTIDVVPNTDYNFSTWIASTFPTFPADLLFEINAASVGSFTASTTTGLWEQFSTTWNSGLSTLATISIVDQNIQRLGNDFALDDISFEATEATPVPEPFSVLGLLAVGIFGMGALLRRKKRWQDFPSLHQIH